MKETIHLKCNPRYSLLPKPILLILAELSHKVKVFLANISTFGCNDMDLETKL